MKSGIKSFVSILLALLLVLSPMLALPVAAAVSYTIATTGGTTLIASSDAVVIDSGIIISAPGTISGARVSIIENFKSGDTLWYTGTLPSGLSASYNSTTGALTFTGDVSATDLQNLLRTVTFRKSTTDTTDREVKITFSLGSAVPGTNGHFYEYVEGSWTWDQAKTEAKARQYLGLQGYLATITDSDENTLIDDKVNANAWIGASDATTENDWYWETGPEAGTLFFTDDGIANDSYHNWASGEPNDAGGEDYAHIYGATDGTWNDFPGPAPAIYIGYIVEYGDMSGDPVVTLSADRSIEVKNIVSIGIELDQAENPDRATITTYDTSSSPLGGQSITVYIDGIEKGSHTTNESGVYLFDIPANIYGGTHELRVEAEGDVTKAVEFKCISIVTSGTSVTASGVTASPVVVDNQLLIQGFDDSFEIPGARVTIDPYKSGDQLIAPGTLPDGVSSSWGSTTGSLIFSGNMTASELQAVLRAVSFKTTSTDVTARIISFTIGSALPGPNGRFYEFVSDSVNWTSAKNGASSKTYLGMQGYLATITSANENALIKEKLGTDAWIGATDAASEGTWKWAAGPESGQTLLYTNWRATQPDNWSGSSSGDENYAEMYTDGTWNDLDDVVHSAVKGYVVEYGGMSDYPVLSLSASQSVAIDNTQPSVTIDQADGQSDPSNNSTLSFTAIFSETVTGFSSEDVILSGTAGGTKTVAISGSGTTYTVSVSGITSDGTVIAQIAAGAAQDATGNSSTASNETTSNIVMTPPTVSFNTNGNASAAKSQSTVVTATPTSPASISALSYQWTNSTAFPTTGTWTDFTSGSTMTQNTGTGTFYLHIQATDNAGNSSQTTSNGFVLDNTAPQTPELEASRTTPTNGDVFVYCTYSADSVIKEYKIGSGEWLSYPVSGYIRIASNTTVYARGTDAAGNVSPEADLLISNIVKTAPAIQFTPDGNLTAAKMHSTVVAATATSPAAINMLLYQWTKSASLPTAGTWTSLDSGDTLSWSSGDGLYYLHIKAFDDAGNVSSDSSSGFLLDNTAPDTPSLVASTSAPTNQDVTITITYPGDSVTNEYRVDNGAWTFYDSTEKVVVSGNCTVYARATDSAGNISTSNLIQITNIVKTPPFVTIVTNGNSDSEKVQSTIVNFSVSDPAEVASSEFQWTMSSTFPTSGTWTTFASGDTLSQSSGDGDFYLHVRVTDTAGNGTEISSNTFLLDNTAPTVTINQSESQDDPSNNETIYFTVVFSEPVTGFSNSDVTLTGTSGGTKAINVTGGETTYTVSVTGMTDGTLVASLSEGVASDAAGNTSTASTSTDNTVLYDITRPTVTINQAESQDDPSNNDTLYFNVVFSEPVTGFTNSDVTLAGTAGGRKTLLVTGSGTTYTVSVTGMTDGTVIASLAEGVAADAAGNTNTASTFTDNSILYDITRPTVTINQAEGQDDPSNNDTLYFTVVFSEEVTGLTADDITLLGTSGGAKTINVTGSGTTYAVTVTGMTDGTVIASLAEGVAVDAAGNTSTASTSTDHSILYDITRPTVTINQSESQDDPSNNDTLFFTVVFSEEVAGLTSEDITFSGTAGGTKSVTVTDSGNHKLYTVSVSGMTDGTVIASLTEGVAADTAGNSSTASTSTDNSILYDITRPTVTINQARGQADPSLTKPVYFTVVFSEPFSDFTSEDIYISGSANPRSVSISGSGLIYNVSVSGMTQTGSVKATVRAGAVYDAAGNTSLASTSLDNTVTYDTRVHAVTLATTETGGVRTTDLGLVVAIPEMWMTDTDMVEFWLESTEIRSITPETEYSYVSLARSRLYAAGYQLLTPYDIELMQRVYKSSGEVTISKVDNSHIRGNVTVLLPIPSELLGFSDLNIAFIDDSGAVAILDVGRVTIDGVEYLEFANNHFSVYAIVSVADANNLPPIPATSDASSPKINPFLATVYGITIFLLGLVLAWYRWMIRRRRVEESISG